MSEPAAEIESPSPSQSMSSSQSSEGSSIAGYVVVDKCEENAANADRGENGKPAEIAATSEITAQGGSTPQDELAERVQNLTKENDELKGVLLQNNKLLEEYNQVLAGMQKSQKETKETSRKGYEHAKDVVKKLREKNITLKMELKNEQNKSLRLEEELSKVKEAKLNGVESEKYTLEMSTSKLQEHLSCLKAVREAESNTETDECETLISMESLPSDIQTSPAVLQENFKKLETEKEILKVDLEKIKIEKEQTQQQCSKLEEERDTLLQKLADLEQRQALEVDEIKPEVTDTQAAAAAAADSNQVQELCEQLKVQTEALSNVKEQLDEARQEIEMYRKKAKEVEKGKESSDSEDFETLKQQLQSYQEKERKDQEASAALQAEVTKETAELKQQLETEKEVIEKLSGDVVTLTQERDGYKKKVEELEIHPEESKGSGDDSVGEVEDTEQKGALVEKLKKQIWIYQQREGDILNRENAVLEKEEEHKQLTEEIKRLKQQLNSTETREHEINQLKEELQNTNTALTEAMSNAEQLKGSMTQLMEQTENCAAECEKLKVECAQKEEEVQSLKEQLGSVSSELNESHEHEEHEVSKLKDELSRKGEELEPLKVQVTQLIQENQSLTAEQQRIMDDYTTQENMYQDHLHKITEDSESQRLKRDEIIKGLRKQVSALEIQLQNAHVKLEADSTVHQQLRDEYQELLQAYQTTMEANKSREIEERKARAGFEDERRQLIDELKNAENEMAKLNDHLTDADDHCKKLKEDIKLREDEIERLRESAFDSQNVYKAQLDLYSNDFKVERDAREKQHEEILHLREQVQKLTQDNQRLADEIDQLGNRGMAELQRRHASFVPEPRDIQPPQQQQEQPRAWWDGWFPRGPMDPPGVQNPPAEMGSPGREQIGGNQREQQAPRLEEDDWQCPTCRRVFPDFNTLQMHAVECAGDHVPRPEEHIPNQCPSCMEILPDMDSLQIHIEDCLDRNQ